MKTQQIISAYDELVDFIAGADPKGALAFRLSPESAKRVETLVQREKDAKITPAEQEELDTYMHLSRIIMLAQSQAYKVLYGSPVS
ncbi:MAG: hypothetical protein ACE5I1_31735 [bacterium]